MIDAPSTDIDLVMTIRDFEEFKKRFNGKFSFINCTPLLPIVYVKISTSDAERFLNQEIEVFNYRVRREKYELSKLGYSEKEIEERDYEDLKDDFFSSILKRTELIRSLEGITNYGEVEENISKIEQKEMESKKREQELKEIKLKEQKLKKESKLKSLISFFYNRKLT